MTFPYVIDNFKAGVDTRYPVFAPNPGTLGVGRDGHLTTAGHFEVRKEFVKLATLPPETFGLAQRQGTVYVFGSDPRPAGLPVGFEYQRLQHPTGAQMTALLDDELFDGKFYTISAFTSDVVHHYDGARGAHWQVATEAVDPQKFRGGTSARTLGEKVYVTNGANVNFSKIDDPLTFITEADNPSNTGAGLINMSIHSTGAEDLRGCELYYASLAVFSNEALQIWNMTADPTTNARVQTLRGPGLVGPRAAKSYMDGDTFFLARQGIKAVRPRDISSGRSKLDNASAPIDRELLPFLEGLSDDDLAKSIMLQEPENNRLWVIIRDRIYVMSHFPEEGVSTSWTEYRPGFAIDAATVCNRRVYVRSGDDVYLYGGPNNDQYFSGQAVMRLPYVTARAPTTFKDFISFDVGVEGIWEIWQSVDPDVPESFERVAIVTGQTFTQPDYPLVGTSTHLTLELRHTGNEYGRVSVVALNFGQSTTG